MKRILEAVEVIKSVESENTIKGCSPEELNELDAMLPVGYTLPTSMKSWLSYCGKECGQFFRTRPLSYREVKFMLKTRFADCRRPLFMEEGDEFPDNLLIFYEYMASYMAFLYLDDGDDPPVLVWDDSMDELSEATQKFEKFSDYLMESVTNHRTYMEERAQFKANGSSAKKPSSD